MSLSPNITAALTGNSDRFLKVFPVNELLNSLQLKGILSYSQVEEIEHLQTTQNKNAYILKVLLNERDDEDFYLLCQMLKENNVNAVRRLGDKLLDHANGK